MLVIPAVNTYKSYSTYSMYTGVVTGMPASAYDTNVAARMYITYNDANGIEQTYYYTEDSEYSIGGGYYTTYNKEYNASNK